MLSSRLLSCGFVEKNIFNLILHDKSTFPSGMDVKKDSGPNVNSFQSEINCEHGTCDLFLAPMSQIYSTFTFCFTVDVMNVDGVENVK